MTFPFPVFVPAVAAAPVLPYASYVFNGTDEYLQKAWDTTGGDEQKASLSVWVEPAVGGSAAFALTSQDEEESRTAQFVSLASGQTAFFSEQLSVLWLLTMQAGLWNHILLSIDTTQAAQANRLRIYRDGNPVSILVGSPAQNVSHDLLGYSGTFYLGFSAVALFQGKLAFIDFVDGAALDPTDFAFDDNGTWTRKPYTGSYGNFGFRLDGSGDFNDTSGNGHNFTPVNMTVNDNLDPDDLPPHI